MKTQEQIEDAYQEANDRVRYYESNQSRAYMGDREIKPDKKVVEEVNQMRKEIEERYDDLLDGNKGMNHESGVLYGRLEILKWIFSDED